MIFAQTGVGGGSGRGTSISDCTGANTNGKSTNGAAFTSANYGIAIGCNAYAYDKETNGTFTEDRSNPFNNASHTAYGILYTTGNPVSSLAIGTNAYAHTLSTALGPSARALGAGGSIAVGAAVVAQGASAIALGRQAAAIGNYSIAQGNVSAATNTGSVAIGHSATATGYRAIAIGTSNILTANEVAGQAGAAYHPTDKTLSSGENSIALGSEAKATNDNALSIGTQSQASGNRSIALGNNAGATAINAIALGESALSTLDNAVAIGALSNTNEGAKDIQNMNINGLTFGAFAGRVSASGMQISVGKAGQERQIKNVAAGVINMSSTDAINGSQLYSTNQIIGNIAQSIKNALGDNATLSADGTIIYTNIGGSGKNNLNLAIASSKTEVQAGKNTVVQQTKGTDGQSIYMVSTSENIDVNQVNTNNLTVKGETKLGNQFAVNSNGDVSYSGKIENDTSIVNKAYVDKTAASSKTEVQAGKNTVVQQSKGADGSSIYTVSTSENIDAKQVTTNNLTVKGETKLGNQFTVNSSGDVSYSGKIENDTSIVNKAYVDKTTASSKTEVQAGKNTVVQQSKGADGQSVYTVSLAENIDVNQVTTNNLTVKGETKLGNQFTVNSNGDVSYSGKIENDTSIVNKAYVDKTTASSKTEVQAGKNTVVQHTKGEDGRSIYTVSTSENIDAKQVTTNNLTVKGETKLGNQFTVNSTGDVSYNGKIENDTNIVNKAYVDKTVTTLKTEVQAGKNTVVQQSKGEDGRSIYTVSTSENIDAKQVTTDNLTVKGETKLGNQFTVNSTGDVSYNGKIENATNIVNKAYVDKTVTTLKTEVQAGKNTVIQQSKGTDGQSVYTVSITDKATFDEVTVGDTVIRSEGVFIKNGPSVSNIGVDMNGLKMINVAKGDISSNSTDAVNGAQLYELDKKIINIENNYNQITNTLNNRIDDVERKTNAGIAAAMALEVAPYVAGKWTYAAGAAYHQGENAIGVTLRKTSDNGRWAVTGGLATASKGSFSIRMGVSGVLF